MLADKEADSLPLAEDRDLGMSVMSPDSIIGTVRTEDQWVLIAVWAPVAPISDRYCEEPRNPARQAGFSAL